MRAARCVKLRFGEVRAKRRDAQQAARVVNIS
jgi:hypothetical protein